ncbi:hypothetical protein H6B10_17065, partial [Gemmiger formicilis]|uniref:hypothetical protein n=1 Tax=Gemmiger formicilis TaxID=745368 RepID=UPI001958F948
VKAADSVLQLGVQHRAVGDDKDRGENRLVILIVQAGQDGGAGNPATEDGDYVTSYLWKEVLQKDKLLDILQKF